MEFRAWGKTPRLNRDMVITEKIDGTNACVFVGHDVPGLGPEVGAQSRNRILTLDNDNHGFARWVHDNHDELASTLGEGYHYGEWWGQGIARNYGLKEKRFSLFNTKRWGDADLSAVPGLGTVPVLYEGPFSTVTSGDVLDNLAACGSSASPGFMRPEGIIVYHAAANQIFKVTVDHDEKPKTL